MQQFLQFQKAMQQLVFITKKKSSCVQDRNCNLLVVDCRRLFLETLSAAMKVLAECRQCRHGFTLKLFYAFLLCWPGSGGQCSISERLVACVKPTEINVDSFCKAERLKELSRNKSTFSCEPQGTPPSLGCTWHSPLTEARCIKNRNNNCTRKTKH